MFVSSQQVFPAKAGIQRFGWVRKNIPPRKRMGWIPVFAGMAWLGLSSVAFAQALVYPTPGTEKPAAAAPSAAKSTTPSLTSAAAASASAEAAKLAEADAPGYQIAVLLATNKVTARSTQIEAALGTTVRFGNLEMIAKRCQTEAPPARADQGALIDVWELKPSERPQEVFHGWMFAGSPSLSALQHPVYDITLLRCDRKLTAPDS